MRRISLRSILFKILSFFLYHENQRLKKIKKEINKKLYSNTKTEVYVNGDSPDLLRVHVGKFSDIVSDKAKIAGIKVIKSSFYDELHGEPTKNDLNDKKKELSEDIKDAKKERNTIMSVFLFIFFAILGYLLKIIIYDKGLPIKTLISAYYFAIIVGLFLNYITQNKLLSRRRKSYRAHLSLLYIEDIYRHLTSQRTTTNKMLSYDEDGLQKNIYSTTYLELMTILVADIIFVGFSIFGYYFFT